MNEAPKLELTLEDLYRIIGELEVARRKLQEVVTKLQQDNENRTAKEASPRLDFPKSVNE